MLTLRQAVCVIVHDTSAGRIAAVNYANDSWAKEPTWTVPGGKVEEGERIDLAAVRELREETGLVVEPADLRLVHTIQVREGWDGKGGFLLHAFATTRFDGELTNNEPDKHLAVTWVPADPDRLPMPMFVTSHASLLAHLTGSTGFSTHGWEHDADPRAVVRARPPRS
ncbi:NUDIX domain-containing protein [Kitasatospora sp. NPDC004289]